VSDLISRAQGTCSEQSGVVGALQDAQCCSLLLGGTYERRAARADTDSSCDGLYLLKQFVLLLLPLLSCCCSVCSGQLNTLRPTDTQQ
jgi:hypothetical protein